MTDLVLATGPRLAFEKVPGLGPLDGHTRSIRNLDHALLGRDASQRFLQNPGPIVIGTAPGRLVLRRFLRVPLERQAPHRQRPAYPAPRR
jgi:hypothetical protein